MQKSSGVATAFRGDDDAAEDALQFFCFVYQRLKPIFAHYVGRGEDAQAEVRFSCLFQCDAHFTDEIRFALGRLSFRNVGWNAGSSPEDLRHHHPPHTGLLIQMHAQFHNSHREVERAFQNIPYGLLSTLCVRSGFLIFHF